MVAFPTRKITDKRIYKSDGTSTALFHDKNYSSKLMGFKKLKLAFTDKNTPKMDLTNFKFNLNWNSIF